MSPNTHHGPLRPNEVVSGLINSHPAKVIIINNEQLTINTIVRDQGAGAVIFDKQNGSRRAVVYLDEEETTRLFLEQLLLDPGPFQDEVQRVYERARVQAGARGEGPASLFEVINMMLGDDTSTPY